jgi:hypothetical protein
MFLSKHACLGHVNFGGNASLASAKTMEKKRMTNFKPLAAAVIATAMLTTPVLAKQHHLHHVRHVAVQGTAVAAPAGVRYVNGRNCVPAPRVDAFATAPWENETPCEP